MLRQKSVMSDGDNCKIFDREDGDTAMTLDVTCNSNAKNYGGYVEIVNGEQVFHTKAGTIILKKTDEKTIVLKKSKDQGFNQPDKSVSYCGEDAQQKYIRQQMQK